MAGAGMNARGAASESVAPAGISSLSEGAEGGDGPESRYECPVCLNWLREPVITTCGHRFCRACITLWLQTSGHCPIDNVDLTMKVDIFPDNFTRREIQQQRAACPHAARGCPARVSPPELESHAALCEFGRPPPPPPSELTAPVPCAFRELGCEETCDSRETLAAHLHTDIQQHMSLLMRAYSEVKLQRDLAGATGAAAGAAAADGKEQEAMCLWEPCKGESGEPGESGDGARRSADSTSALIRALYERVVVLEQRAREQDIALGAAGRQLAAAALAARRQQAELALRHCAGDYVWRVDGFRARLDAMRADRAKMLYSPGFYTSPNGYRFCARLNISAQNEECLALHLHLMRSEWDECLEWPFSGRITIAMVNRQEPERTQRDTMMSNSQLLAFRRPRAEICLRGFGYAEYAPLAHVLRGGFLRDDTLLLRLTVKCV